MASITAPYLLAHRHGDAAEDRRLDEQHYVVKDGILDGVLIHPLIKPARSWTAIADLGCGTGVWLNDVARSHFADRRSQVQLTGFDSNPARFTQRHEPGVELVQHDCTAAFDERYHGTFDLVNIRVIVFAIPAAGVEALVRNAVRLLKPGGYLQWGESEPRSWRPTPASPAISRALELLNEERKERQLVQYMPHFMLESALHASPTPSPPSSNPVQPPALQILHFQFFQGGITPDNVTASQAKNTAVSHSVLAALKLLLQASVVRLSAVPGQSRAVEEISRVQAEIETAIARGSVHMGGDFPFLVAKRNA